jgi:hypothetical protein
MDDAFTLPGTRLRFGLDGVLGLIPGVGDALSTGVGCYIIWNGIRAGARPATILRMVKNLALDSICGAVPFIGDLFDFAFKANRRNLELLQEDFQGNRLTTERDSRSATKVVWAVFALLLAIVVIVSIALAFLLANLFDKLV